jgi:hypothetical protein
MMREHKLLYNKTNIKEFDSFNDGFSLRAVSLCPLLNKFQINVVNHDKTTHVKDGDINDNDAFVYYLNKEGKDASTTYAEIIVNEEMCKHLQLTEEEIWAATAHEIGHIIIFFRSDKEDIQGQTEEICSDYYACKMGLATPLSSLIQKMINFCLYEDWQVKLMQKRLYFISYF